MNETIDKIGILLERIKTSDKISDEQLKKFNDKIRLEFNFNSNHIEGNTLTYGETKLLLIFGKTEGVHELREFEEMRAHDVAFKFIKDIAGDINFKLTENTIRELNKIILVSPFWKEAKTDNGQNTRREIKIGQYKEFPNSVRLQNGEIFEYASPLETPIKMKELLDWYHLESNKKELSPIEIAAIFHHKFVLIHPFDDGNGRIARLLMNYILIKNELTPVVIKSSDKKNYLNALNQADSGNLNAFIKYIGEQVLWSLELYIKAINNESIEEVDDIDKEIEILKRKLTTKKDIIIKKEREIIHEFLVKLLDPLFFKIYNKHTRFNELFYENSTYLNIIYDNREFKKEKYNHIQSIVDVIRGEYKYGVSNKLTYEVEYELILKGYKKHINANNLDYKLKFRFEEFNFKIIFNRNELDAKCYPYDIDIKEDFINEIAKTYLKLIIEELNKI